jgi:hypothetical protein
VNPSEGGPIQLWKVTSILFPVVAIAAGRVSPLMLASNGAAVEAPSYIFTTSPGLVSNRLKLRVMLVTESVSVWGLISQEQEAFG